MSSIYTSEYFYSYPIPQDGVSFSSVNAENIKTYIAVGNTLFGGSYSFDTVTITLKGINIPPFTKPLSSNITTTSFTFRNRTWILLDVVEGYKYNIAGSARYESWSCTGLDITTPRIKII